jgi:hypothetical protein
MKQITVRIIILSVFAWSACCVQAAGENRMGLYSKKNQVVETTVKESAGLYKTEMPQVEGLLRAGGTEGDGGGNPNKVPVRDNLLLLLLGAATYLVIRKNSKRRFLDL